MTNILFVCLGNICRSPMAEFVFRDLAEKRGLGDRFTIASAATSGEELGSPVHPGTRRRLAREGISEDYAWARVKAQRPDGYFIQNCDDTLINDLPAAEEFSQKAREFLKEVLP